MRLDHQADINETLYDNMNQSLHHYFAIVNAALPGPASLTALTPALCCAFVGMPGKMMRHMLRGEPTIETSG
jgi:hypothetical protein